LDHKENLVQMDQKVTRVPRVMLDHKDPLGHQVLKVLKVPKEMLDHQATLDNLEFQAATDSVEIKETGEKMAEMVCLENQAIPVK